MTKKVLIIPDFPHWALDKNARDLLKYNRSDLQLDICYADDFFKQWRRYLEQFDLLFPMYLGTYFEFFKRKIPIDRVVTGVRSFVRWDHGKTQPPGYNVTPPRKIIRRLKKAVLVNTHCAKLWYIFSRYIRIIHTKYSCDLEMFFPEPGVKKSKKLIVGWTGSLTNHPGKRGFHEFIRPICNELADVELKVQAKEDNFITDDNRMRRFYNSLDLYICASRSEGTPRPVIEAAACGVPIISTDVGIVPELINHNINGWIVKRNYAAIKAGLEQALRSRDQLPEMGKALRTKMEREFNWKKLIFQWTDFFDFALELITLKSHGQLK